MSTPTIILVHGAFADSSSWNGVLEHLANRSLTALALANPLRSLSADSAYLTDIIESVGDDVILVGHSYGGMLITEAGSHPAVRALVYVAAFAPDTGESALGLSGMFPGSTLGDAVSAYAIQTGGNELVIRRDRFHAQFAADVPASTADLMSATQRPVTERALTEELQNEPAWRARPSSFIYGDQDLNIPVATLAFMSDRAAPVEAQLVDGGSHALPISQPKLIAEMIAAAAAAVA